MKTKAQNIRPQIGSALTAIALCSGAGLAQEISPTARTPIDARPLPFVALYVQEPALPLPANAGPKKPVRLPAMRKPAKPGPQALAHYLRPQLQRALPAFLNPPGGGVPEAPDVMVADGSETSLAIDVGNPNLILATVNRGFSNTPAMLVSSNANGSWASRVFPSGGGSYNGGPFDPWANAGNVAGEFFATFCQRDSLGSENTRVVIAKSVNSGATFPLFYAVTNRISFQDREMADIDRTAALGGGAGSTHDGKIYLCFDDYGPNYAGYAGSLLHIISTTGTRLSETAVSSSSVWRGSQLQPLAGANDGQCFIMGNGQIGAGATSILYFHLVTAAGQTFWNRSNIQFSTPGQQLGGSGYFGLNGHRIDTNGYIDIDRSNATTRGRIYVVHTRNPSPSNSNADQGDIYISRSSDNAATWQTAILPSLAAGKTQYFPMLDVDDNGWVHVAYYQNEAGVLNSATANLYYTYSTNGGQSWSAPAQVNSAVNTLNYSNPPPNLAGARYYLVGDYAQLKVTGTGAATTAYVLWTTYDKNRSGTTIGNSRDRVICTTIPPAASSGACCIGGVCNANMSQANCTAQGGTFFAGQACASVSCPPAVPVNNNCANATVVAAGVTTFNSSGATTDGPGNCPVSQDIWYRFTSGCAGQATVQVSSSAFTPAVAVYSGTACPPSGQLACGVDGTGQVNFPVAANGTYTVRVGAIGAGTGAGSLTIIVPGTTPPSVTQHPTSQVICIGGSAEFSVTAAGGAPLFYQWRRNGTNIPGATASQYQITNAQPSQSGSYTCVVTNSCGSITSNPANLTVGGTPVITQQPPAALAAGPGQNLSMSVAATGVGLSYQWRRNGESLTNSGPITGVNSPTLMINSVVPSLHDGVYTVEVSSSCGGSTISNPTLVCYANCDRSTGTPALNIFDLVCFLDRFSTNSPYANCDGSTGAPLLTVADFSCFLQKFVEDCQ